MSRPRLLDLFCRAGGAAKGYHDAGFDVDGVDIESQKRYPYRFFQGDALEFVRLHGHEYDAIHASPPCQAYCALKSMPNAKVHPDLIGPTRDLLNLSGKPYVIENVVGAPLLHPVTLCGTMFGLQTDCGAVLRRHRLFEANWLLMVGLECRHRGTTLHVAGSNPWTGHMESAKQRTVSMNGHGAWDCAANHAQRTISIHGDHPRDNSVTWEKRRTICANGSTPQQNVERNRVRECFPVSAARTAMGIDWMPMADLSQAIPPAYTYYIGQQLIQQLEGG